MSISDFIMGIEDYEDVQRWKKMAKCFRPGDAAALSLFFMNEICPDQEEGRNCDLCGREAKDLCDLISRVQAAAEMAEGKIGPDADAKQREGLYGKYCISKADGSPVDPNADYFVLRLDTDPVARRAAREYSYVTPDRDLARGLQDSLAKYDPQLKDCMNIQFFGLEKPHCWQITEERKAAIDRGLQFLEWSYAKNSALDTKEQITVLWAMLDEAGQ